MLSGFLNKLLKADVPQNLGDTQSGKPVLGAGQESYAQGFNEQDHLDAQKIHEQKAAQSEKYTQNAMLKPGAKFDLKGIAQQQNSSEHHHKMAEWHQQQSSVPPNQEAKGIQAAGQAQNTENVRKSFLDRLIKGGPGSGQKGHFTARTPFPQPAPKPQESPKTHVPNGGFLPHYSDSPTEAAYKKFITYLKKQGKDFDGHISMDKETGHIIPISDVGKQHIQEVKDLLASKPSK
jgi:hypothetical protein